MDRIISKEEEREDPRRDTSVFFEYSGVSTFYKISSNTVYSTVFPHAIQQLQVSTSNSTYRISSSPRNTTTTRLIPCRLLPTTVPRVSKHSTWQNPAIRPYSTSRLPVNSTRQKQHSKWQPASTQPLQQVPRENPPSTTRIHLVLQKFYQEK